MRASMQRCVRRASRGPRKIAHVSIPRQTSHQSTKRRRNRRNATVCENRVHFLLIQALCFALKCSCAQLQLQLRRSDVGCVSPRFRNCRAPFRHLLPDLNRISIFLRLIFSFSFYSRERSAFLYIHACTHMYIALNYLGINLSRFKFDQQQIFGASRERLRRSSTRRATALFV